MSRAFVLDTPSNPKTAKVEKGRTVAETVDKQTAVLRAVADEISSLSPEVVNEAVIATASNEEGKTAEMKAKKLEALRHQNELILCNRWVARGNAATAHSSHSISF